MSDLPSSIVKINDIEVSQDAPLTEALMAKKGSTINGLIDENTQRIADDVAINATITNNKSAIYASSDVSYSTNSGSYVDVTGCTITFTGKARTCLVLIEGGSMSWTETGGIGGLPACRVLRNGVALKGFNLPESSAEDSVSSYSLFSTSISGSTTFKLQVKGAYDNISNYRTANISGVRIVVLEIA